MGTTAPVPDVPVASAWDLGNVALVGGAAVAAVGWLAWSFRWTAGESKLWAWLAMLAILTAFTLGVGHALTGTWKAVLVDDRNKTSLSRLQLALWTGLVLSAFATAVAWNRAAGSDNPLAVEVPQELWLLMGISTASLAGSTLIKGDQEKRASVLLNTPAERLPPTAAARKADVERTLAATDQVAEGQLARNQDAAMARWTDMFKGEGIGDFAYLDLGKVQLFFFTMVLVLLYAVTVGAEFAALGESGFFAFPVFDEAMLALLGISHAGYLATKAAKQSGSF